MDCLFDINWLSRSSFSHPKLSVFKSFLEVTQLNDDPYATSPNRPLCLASQSYYHIQTDTYKFAELPLNIRDLIYWQLLFYNRGGVIEIGENFCSQNIFVFINSRYSAVMFLLHYKQRKADFGKRLCTCKYRKLK